MTMTAQPTLPSPVLPAPAQPAAPVRQGLVLEGIRWQTYEALLNDLGEHARPRMAFDRGRLEIMTPLFQHERYANQLGQFVRVLALAAMIPCTAAGSMTIRRQDLERGIEPDNCFYLVSWPLIRGRSELDFTQDPPPDLAFEIDMTHSSLDRLGIYAALRVPEVWRFDGTTFRCYHRNNQGNYDEHPTSRAFPFLRLADVVSFLAQVFDVDETTLTQRFQTWVQAQLPPPPAQP
jgi:Uma2 family endonuclease